MSPVTSAEAPGRIQPVPGWAWALLAALAAYIIAMYGWVMRLVVGPSAVLMPWLLRQPGYRLYENVYLPYMPGYAWLGMGASLLIHDPLLRARLLMIVSMLLELGLVVGLARRWWGLIPALAGAALYAAWGPVFMDRPFYLEVPLGLFSLLAVLVWHRAGNRWYHPLLAGLLVGCAVLMKQQGLAVAAVFVIWRLLSLFAEPDWKLALRDIALFLAGFALPTGLTALVLAAESQLDNLIYWTWSYALGNPFERRTILDLDRREQAILMAWLAFAPVFLLHTIRRREQWRGEGILLLGLLAATLTPIYPLYGRFHLSAATPFVALLGAGGVAALLPVLRQNGWPAWGARLYAAGGVLLLLVAFALPTYYRVKLGPLIGEYGPLHPVGGWLQAEGVEPGTRVWVLPEIDPTANLVALGGYLPPTVWVQTYPWFQEVPGMPEQVITAVEAAPPRYVVVFERWREMLPPPFEVTIAAHYVPVGQVEAGADYGLVTVYALE